VDLRCNSFFAILQERCDSDILESFHFRRFSSKVPVKLDVFTAIARILQFNQAVHFAGAMTFHFCESLPPGKTWPSSKRSPSATTFPWMKQKYHIPRAIQLTSPLPRLTLSPLSSIHQVGRHRSPIPRRWNLQQKSQTSTSAILHRVSTKYRSYAQCPFPNLEQVGLVVGIRPLLNICIRRKESALEQWRLVNKLS